MVFAGPVGLEVRQPRKEPDGHFFVDLVAARPDAGADSGLKLSRVRAEALCEHEYGFPEDLGGSTAPTRVNHAHGPGIGIE